MRKCHIPLKNRLKIKEKNRRLSRATAVANHKKRRQSKRNAKTASNQLYTPDIPIYSLSLIGTIFNYF